MTNTFAQIDHLASAGDSPWHRSSALTKLLLALTYVTIAVVTLYGMWYHGCTRKST